MSMEKLTKLIIWILIFSLTGCRAPDNGVNDPDQFIESDDDSDGKKATQASLEWKYHVMPIAYSQDALGGMDIHPSEQGHLQVAFLIKELDLSVGAYVYRLYLARNQNGYWELEVLKSSLSQFYRSTYSNSESNRVKLIMNSNSEAVVLYVDKDNRLIKVEKDGSRYREAVLIAQEVDTFAVAYDSSLNRLHIASMKRYYNAREVSYHLFSDDYLVESFIYTGEISPGTATNHLEVILDQGEPLIFVKYYDNEIRSGRFLMIKNQTGYVLANGVNPSGLFNVYIKEGALKSCYRNIIDERYILSLNLHGLSLRHQKIGVSDSAKRHSHCLVTLYSEMDFASYNLNQNYGNFYETISTITGNSSQSLSSSLEGIETVIYKDNKLFIAGIDKNTKSPAFLEKR